MDIYLFVLYTAYLKSIMYEISNGRVCNGYMNILYSNVVKLATAEYAMVI